MNEFDSVFAGLAEQTAPKSSEVDPQHPHPGQWRLNHVQLSNWGTFHGTHELAISTKGFFLTGGPGTGKSTLLDAISALLTPPRSLHFNAAASEGPKSKYRRTIASYVRGAYAMHYDPVTAEFSQEVLRDKTTLSVISLRYSNGLGETLQLSRMFLLAAGHSLDSDVKSLYVISRQALDVSDLRPFVGSTIEGKALENHFPNTQTFRQFREYRAKFSQLLGIPDEKALGLLHKIQSAKELGDVNALLRDYMLDEPRTFDLADQALANFQNLSEVYAALVTARQQRDTLQNLKIAEASRSEAVARGQELVSRRNDIDLFAAQHLVRMLSEESEKLELEQDRLRAQRNRISQDIADSRHDLAQLKEQRKNAGGSEIDNWKKQIAGLEVERDRRLERAREFSSQVALVNLSSPSSEETFLALQREVNALKHALEADEKNEAQANWEAQALVREISKELELANAELKSLTARASNLHSDDVALRDLLAKRTNVSAADLPFAAELLQVKAGEEEWSAAAEQALGPIARSILVPERIYQSFAREIDSMKLRRRVVYNRINTAFKQPVKKLPPRALGTKIEIKEGEFYTWLEAEISNRMDYICAEDLAEFTKFPRAVLRSGQIKHSATRHEKNAEHSINDRSRWVLGFDNRGKRKVFEQKRIKLEQDLFEAQAKLKDLSKAADLRLEKLFALQAIAAVTWDDIDAASVARRIANLAQMVRAAEDGSSALTEIAQQINQIETAIAEGDEELLEIVANLGRVGEQLSQASEKHQAAKDQLAQGALAEATEADLAKRFKAIAPVLMLSNIEQVKKDASATLDAELMELTKVTARAEEDMRTAMREFVRNWPAEAADLDYTLASVGEFLGILQRIEEEKLPDVEERFFEFFTGNTLGDVQALATAIAREPAQIKKRLSKINELLAQVEFHEGRYLQLSMRPVHLAALSEFKQALNQAVSSTVEQDLSLDRQKAEERFIALKHLMDIITKARTLDSASHAILDVRRHVHFHAEEVNAAGEVVHAHESGGPLSGGQNERLTTFCLAAALRYQLAGTGVDVPTYAPIIIDEAFSKGAGKFITAAMESFRHFGFQVVLANPGKNPQSLAPFIGGVGVVSIKDDRYSSVSPIEFVEVNE